MRVRTLFTMCLPLAAACSSANSTPGTQSRAEPVAQGAQPERAERGDRDGEFDHIFFIMMENHATKEILGNTTDAPFINELATKYSVATDYFGVTHPSLPNYLAAFSGSFQGIWDDCAAGQAVTCAPEEFVPGSGDGTDGNYLTATEIASASSTPHWFDGRNLVDQLEAHHLTWKAYMQSMPADDKTIEYAPVLTSDAGAQTIVKLYAQKHNPFMYFSDIRENPERMDRIVPFTSFEADLSSRDLPNFVWISPDQCHDMHGVSPSNAAAIGIPSCGYPDSGLDHGAIALGDAFLKDTVQKIMSSPAWSRRSAIAIAWDEDDYAGFAGCCESPTGVGGVVLGGANAPALVVTSTGVHKVSSAPFNHYALLATIERLWNLGCLNETCDFHGADLMTSLFQR